MSHFQQLTCFLYFIVNKILVYDILTLLLSLLSFFLLSFFLFKTASQPNWNWGYTCYTFQISSFKKSNYLRYIIYIIFHWFCVKEKRKGADDYRCEL